MNPYEVAARLERVGKIVEFIDRSLGEVVVGERAQRVVETLDAAPTDWWKELALRAGLKTSPSRTTIELVRERFMERSKETM